MEATPVLIVLLNFDSILGCNVFGSADAVRRERNDAKITMLSWMKFFVIEWLSSF